MVAHKSTNVLGKALQQYVWSHTLTASFPHFVDVPGAPEMAGYYPRDEDRAGYAAVRDTQALNASYERFLRIGVLIISLLCIH